MFKTPNLNHIIAAFITCQYLFLSSCRAPSSSRAEPDTVAVAIVSKLDQSPFYARIPTQFERVLVTSIENAPLGVNLSIPENMSLFYVEMSDENADSVVTEVFKHENIRLFFATNEHHATTLMRKFSGYPHPRKVDVTSLKDPEILSTKYVTFNLDRTIPPSEIIDVDSKRLREDLEFLSGARPVFVDGRQVIISNRATVENKTLARKWLGRELEASGYIVSEHNYGSGVNLIADKPSQGQKDDSMLLVTAHLDTVQTAGADDDGSGIVTALTAARALAKQHLARHLRFVAFDEEERGLIGSTAYAKLLAKTGEIRNVSVINIEMTGYDSDGDGEFHAIDCNENTSPNLTETLLSAINSLDIPLRKISACTNRSDHAIFWEYDRPAIVVSQNFFGGDGNPCYHRTCDTVSQVNFDYMYKLTKAAANAVFRLTSQNTR